MEYLDVLMLSPQGGRPVLSPKVAGQFLVPQRCPHITSILPWIVRLKQVGKARPDSPFPTESWCSLVSAVSCVRPRPVSRPDIRSSAGGRKGQVH